MLDDLWSNTDPSREIEVVLLQNSRDGITQITEALAGRIDLDAVHIVSHGTDAAVKPGSTWLTSESLAGYVGEIARWSNSFTDDADILFYGCDLAASDDGRMLIDSFSILTGTDVAANNDDTGHLIFGADWDLEYVTGQIETGVAFSQNVQDNWGHVMNVAVDATSTGTTTGSSVTISHTTSGSNRLMLVGIGIDPHGESVSSVTYNGTSLTLVGSVEDAGSHSRVEIWSLVSPETGTHDVVVSLSGDSHKGTTVGVMTFTGVDQSTPLQNFTSSFGRSTAASATVTSTTDDVVFGVVHVHNGSAATPGAGQTEHWDLTSDKSNSSGTLEAGDASVVTSWTVTNDDWSIGAVSIKAGNSAPAITLPGAALDYSENDSATVIDATATLSDPDSADLDTGILTVDFSSNGTANDRLSIRNQGAGAGQIGVSGSSVTYEGAVIGSFAGGTNGSTPLVVSLNANSSPAAAQALLRNITYQNVSESPSTASRTVRFVLTDENAGTSNTATQTINVTAVNDVPVNQAPDAQVTAVDAPVIFSAANGNTVSVSDVDAGSSSVAVSLVANNGTLSLNGTTGLTFNSGDGTSDQTMQFSGTVTDINSALDGLVFTPDPGFSGAASFTIETDDQGHTGSGGSQGDKDAVFVSVGAVTFQQGTSGYSGTEDTELNETTPSTSHGNASSISIDLENSGGQSQGLIQFNNLFGNGLGQIPFGSTINSASLTVYAFDTSDSSTTISLHRMLTAWDETSTWNSSANGLQRNDVEVSSTADSTMTSADFTGTQTFFGLEDTLQAWSDGAINNGWAIFTDSTDGWDFYSSEYATADRRPALIISFTPPQPPSIDLDANNSSGQSGANFVASFTEDNGPVAIADSDSVLTDTDSSNLTSLTVTISNLLDGASEVLAANVSGTSISASYDVPTGVLTLSGTDSLANYQQVLRTLTYDNTSQSPDTTDLSITFVAYDGIKNSNTATTTVSVTGVNDAPVITSNGGGATAAVNVSENSTAVTMVTSSDVDGGTSVYSISGGADAAKFSIDSSTGVLTFATAPDYESPTDSGSDNVYEVTVEASDGAGGTDSQNISVSVTDVNEFDITAINDTDATANAVDENATVGTTVGITAFASDADATTNGILCTLDDDAAGQFAIDGATGQVTVAGAIDREAGATRTIPVRATSDDGSTTTRDYTISINDLDEFDITAISDNDATANAVDENATVGTTVGITAFASDADATTNGILYTLDNDSAGQFAIDGATGQVTVAGAIDREAGATRTITVRATSDDGSTNTQNYSITINDLNDNMPVVTPGQSFSVSEFASNGQSLGVAAATDEDTVGAL